MPRYSTKSRANLATCHEDLQKVFMKVIEGFDCTIIIGHRTKEEQEEAFRTGHSKAKWGQSPHNKTPSEGVDVAPCPIDWNDRERFHLFAGYVSGIAAEMKRRGEIAKDIRWGGDWDRDTEVNDNTFDDLVHYEVV